MGFEPILLLDCNRGINMKRLVIISEGKNTGIRLYNQLTRLMGEYIIINNMLISELKDTPIIADLIVFTSTFVKGRALRYIDPNINSIVAKRVIDHKNIKAIISIEEGTDVLFINDCYETTCEAIEQIIELGLDHIKYHPYFPDCTSYPKLEIAITPGEAQLAPYNPKTLIDIGSRILDVKTIDDIITILQIDEFFKSGLITEYIRDIIEISRSIDESRRSSYESKEILEMIVNSLDYGVAFVNIEGKIISINSKFEYIFGIKKKNLIGKLFEELFPCSNFSLIADGNYRTQLENKEVSIQIQEVNFSKKIGYIVSVKQNDKLIKNGSKLKLGQDNFLNRKLHNFSDYYTINKDVLQMIKKANKFAKTDGTILIVGENGTGKEILAQGIHTNSYRNKNSFVPINIATISSNLVESELFGYEEGTFTGAIKGGKIGLFEIANGGTIFIDEIGDTPIDVQAKLLRVLEEKRIRRVGGFDELPIDVRIIAATNKDLLDLVNEGKFRLDLFFRINILPLNTIPLRERPEDIEYLLKYFINLKLIDKNIHSLEEIFENETIEFFKSYKWKGNVRELINLVEYLVLIYEDQKIGIQSLHSYMIENKDSYERIILNASEVWILSQFDKYLDTSIGRIRLAELAKASNQNIGEGKIRIIIKNLENLNLIQSINNRGSKITKLGKKVLDEYI